MGPNKRVGPIGTKFSLRWVMKEAKGVDFFKLIEHTTTS
jgi:hypothetical protein